MCVGWVLTGLAEVSLAGLGGQGAGHDEQVEDKQRRCLGQCQQQLHVGGVPLGMDPSRHVPTALSEALCRSHDGWLEARSSTT